MKRKIAINERVKTIAFIVVLALMFSILAPTMKIIATEYGTGNKTFQMGIVIDNENFSVYDVKVNGEDWTNENDVYKTNNGEYSITGKIGTQDETRPELIYGGNLNEYMAANGSISIQPETATEYSFNITLSGVGTEHDNENNIVNFLGLTLQAEQQNPGQQDPEQQGEDDGIEITRMEFTINGQDCIITADNSVVNVPADTNFESLDEFYITRIVSTDRATNEVKDVSFAPGKYGLNIRDDENRPVLETNLTKQTTSIAFLRVEAHVDAITDEHLAILGKTSEDIVGFYLPQIVLSKPNPQGIVQIETPNMPDVYDFVSFNGIELGDTSSDNYSEVTVYYGDDTIDLSGIECTITNIELVEGKGVLDSAVEIDVANKKVKIKSNYYNEIPLKITAQLEDESIVVGYVKILRVGIYINDLNKGSNVFYHGAFNGRVNENGGNLNEI